MGEKGNYPKHLMSIRLYLSFIKIIVMLLL
jgi:hypothetical protein